MPEVTQQQELHRYSQQQQERNGNRQQQPPTNRKSNAILLEAERGVGIKSKACTVFLCHPVLESDFLIGTGPRMGPKVRRLKGIANFSQACRIPKAKQVLKSLPLVLV